ncbi:MAG TPA: hypothetical protein DEB30_04865 [Candidatus Peribacter riflensis]|uniref:Uncharacterized protein n=1 Tax=Candidatus Peribacter riflensis TaxID=1735162 RepID=A0A0S1SJT6_9BACT|nr:MAG: hypothetical protein PeribacterA2_0203 [Candidatus Peribacter riflensis]OGJ76945.1 MAG: hypothetical protein A2398_01690 [Candidatus Peribacteria bacterium RIFOXYB1_FULL_57_12]ALM10699.1 MAG: hypothetical protein PeribacterB2_0203 [Candidatus Peribacter riflensis]ALM11801.1 MAG: hypothetical protein PeribacterC2_0202 [Candidatus Peribacter riflensis]ALM12904.1 MAG: hypothetical protein PeribacterD1_0203 [Candidatus Peribacter riflensis]
MKDEPNEIAGKSFEELVRGPDGRILAAAFHDGKKKRSQDGLGVPGLRKKFGQVLEPAEGEGEG